LEKNLLCNIECQKYTKKIIMSQFIQDLVKKLTLEEKAALCSGQNNWSSKAIERLNIPSIYMTDGPHGLRKESDDGFGNSLPATCFPTAACLASSWNTDLLEEVGAAIGKECQSYNVQILLGPGANIKRSPLNGRNFEYFSEDPIVSGEMAAALIQGIQSQGVATSLKHFVANNQEFERMSVDAKVEERAMREIYLAGFEIAVKKAQPWTMMCAYNRINGTFASEHQGLLHDILKKEWNYEGIVMSDWGAVHDRAKAVEAGLHLEMPGNGGINDQLIVKAVQAGDLDEKRLDEVVGEWLNIVFKTYNAQLENATFEKEAHHALARTAATEGIVLLKNENDVLPIDVSKEESIAVIGHFAKQPRFQGAGSSLVKPTEVDNLWDELNELVGAGTVLTYSAGYDESHDYDEKLVQAAVETAQQSDIAIVCIGLPERFETEGTDRKHIQLPEGDRKLIEAISAVHSKVIVVLTNGSPVEMPWLNGVSSVVEGWLFGQGGGQAMAKVLTGVVNPSGKLTETFPVRLEDTPSFLHFPGTPKEVIYGEGIFVGYRYYEKKKIKPLFPFGHGLSYTKFDYKDWSVSENALDDAPIKVKVLIENDGERSGKEVVQLYVRPLESSVIRPEKELKGFAKIELMPNQAEEAHFELTFRDFAFFDTVSNSWKVEAGTYEILVGSSSTDIRLRKEIQISTNQNSTVQLDRYSTVKQFLKHPKGKVLVQPIYDEMLTLFTKSVPDDEPQKKKEIEQFFIYIINDLPFYKLETFSIGAISLETINKIVEAVKE
jgi:beta-glucosidase